ncbi:DNA methyltransferase [Micromonospora rifamycinica]|uniref:DNA methyltransferase n=1 Tax=Micromonospora rifamycinica TaxID=291594 RepID=UPI0033C98C84
MARRHPSLPAPATRRATPQRRDGASCRRCGATWADPQYGLEPTVGEYVDRLVRVFDEARRALNPTGMLWLNLGDSHTGGTRRAYDIASGITGTPGRAAPLPAKNLIGVPWRTAFALQTHGWWLRNAVIWSKTNPCPSPSPTS